MTKNFFCIFFFLFLSCSCPGVFAQPGFQRLYGGVNQEISLVTLSSPTGSIYYLGATTSTGNGSADPVLMKLDAAGQVLWAHAIGGPEYDVAGAMTMASDGGIVCAGSTRSFNGNTPDDVYFFKTDTFGNMLWSRTFGTADVDVASALVRTADNGYAITGFTRNGALRRVLLIRTDSNGDTLFVRTYGGVGDDQGVEMYETADGGFVITGKTFSQTLGESDILLLRTDALGNLLWAKSFGGQWWDEGAGITRLMDGNYLISGSTISFGQGDFDILVLKTDTSGNILWGKTYGGPKTDASYTARENADSSIVISGYTNSMGYGQDLRMAGAEYSAGGDRGDDSTNVFLMKINSIGDTLWTRTYGDGRQDEAFHFSKMDDGGYLIPGFSTSYTNATDSTQMMIIRTDSLGFSGCHEQDARPVIDMTNFITQQLFFQQSGGIGISTVTSSSLVWNLLAEDACLYIQVGESPQEDAYVFPNPASGLLNIKHSAPGTTTISLFNLVGELVLAVQPEAGQDLVTTLDVSKLAPGIYFLKLNTPASQVSKKIIVQKN
jgi:hypothetical protein